MMARLLAYGGIFGARVRQMSFWTGSLNLAAVASKKVEVNLTPKTVMVSHDKAVRTAVSNLEDNKLYNIGAARKRIFLNFSHSAIAIKEAATTTDENEFMMIGRQSPTDQMNQKYEGSYSYLKWFSDQTVGRLTTRIDNESGYNFFRSQPYNVQMLSPEIALTGVEIKRIIARANSDICAKENFTLVGSNCYSATVTMVADVILAINARSPYPNQNNDLTAVYEVLLRGLVRDNYSQGVSNHLVASDAITAASLVLKKRGLIDEMQIARSIA